jgi:two-component system, OmpR family, osmolarity sensor histidine kinase EnvZ
LNWPSPDRIPDHKRAGLAFSLSLPYREPWLPQLHDAVMRRPIDMLFVRFSLSVIGILLLSHIAWFQLMNRQQVQIQAHYAAEEAVFLVDAVRQHIEISPNVPLPSRVRLVDPSSPEVPPVHRFIAGPASPFVKSIRIRMGPGTDVRVGPLGRTPTLWVRGPNDARWIVVPVYLPQHAEALDRSTLLFIAVFAVASMLALVPAWILHHPLRSLTRAVNSFAREGACRSVPEHGPLELRLLIRRFNEMVNHLKSADYDRTVMLAGIAHDLRTPLARLRLRAEILDDESIRSGIVADVESMAQVVDTFLAQK